MKLFQQIKTAFLLLGFFAIFTGLLYPGFVTIVARFLFPDKASGSLILRDEKVVGSELIGQFFDDPKYFWGRPSSTTPYPYNATASSASNLGPTNPNLVKIMKARIKSLQNGPENSNRISIPIELLQSSGSGLDPHISLDAAKYQVARIAAARQLPESLLLQLIEETKEGPQLIILGVTKVNVLKLNLALDRIQLETQMQNETQNNSRSPNGKTPKS